MAKKTTSTQDSAPKTSKAKKTTKTKPAAKPEKLSAIAAAAKVLAESGQPMTTKEMIDMMAAKRYWTSPGGATPHATLYAAILREVTTKKTTARFKKTSPGHFTLRTTT